MVNDKPTWASLEAPRAGLLLPVASPDLLLSLPFLLSTSFQGYCTTFTGVVFLRRDVLASLPLHRQGSKSINFSTSLWQPSGFGSGSSSAVSLQSNNGFNQWQAGFPRQSNVSLESKNFIVRMWKYEQVIWAYSLHGAEPTSTGDLDKNCNV